MAGGLVPAPWLSIPGPGRGGLEGVRGAPEPLLQPSRCQPRLSFAGLRNMPADVNPRCAGQPVIGV